MFIEGKSAIIFGKNYNKNSKQIRRKIQSEN